MLFLQRKKSSLSIKKSRHERDFLFLLVYANFKIVPTVVEQVVIPLALRHRKFPFHQIAYQ